MATATTISKLKMLSDEELITEYDKISYNTGVGTQYYLDEIRDRSQAKFGARMEALTTQMWWFTLVATVATISSFGLAVWAYVKT
jgi:hypothetical protein